MVVVGNRHADGVNVLAHLVEHLTPVVEDLEGLGLPAFLISPSFFVGVLAVDVADRDEIGELGDLRAVAVALAADADPRDVDAFVGRLLGEGFLCPLATYTP